MPTAVMTESSEKMMSMSTIWMMTPRRADRPAAPAVCLGSALELVVDLVGGLADQEEPAEQQDQVACR